MRPSRTSSIPDDLEPPSFSSGSSPPSKVFEDDEDTGIVQSENVPTPMDGASDTPRPMTRHLNYLSVGVDLGTSNSVVAVCDSRTNKIEVLECNDEPRNPKLLRSMVGYHNGGVRVVGVRAMENLAETEAGNTFFLTKRLLGRRYEEKIVQEVLDGKSFAKNAHARPTKLNAQGGTRGGITEFSITSSEHKIKSVTSEQINAAIVSRLMRLVEEQYEGFSVAESRNIWQSARTIVVISVPANYDAAQRKATRQAAEIAGIPPRNLTLINEPTAAAIHHRESYSSAPPEHLTLLVYDFGGGTLDVTIVQIGYNQSEWLGRCRDAYRKANKSKLWKQLFLKLGKDLMARGSSFQKLQAETKIAESLSPLPLPKKAVAVNVCAVEGNIKLGGYDFTGAIMGVVLRKLRSGCAKMFEGITDRDIDRLLFDYEFRFSLLAKCETAKIELSIKKETQILVHLHALRAVKTEQPVEIMVRQLIMNPLHRDFKPICRVSKVTSTGKIKETNLRLRAKFGDESTQNSKDGDLTRAVYTLEWPSNHLFKRDHCIHMSRVEEIGIGAGRDAPDVLHVLRGDAKHRDKLPRCFWIRFRDLDNAPQSRCFIARDLRSVKIWFQALSEVQGSVADRRKRAKARCRFEKTGATMLHEEVVTRKEFEEAAANYFPRGAERRRNLWDESTGPIEEALNSAKLSRKDIDQVLFVGGTTFMPRIRDLVRKAFPDVPMRRDRAFGAPVIAVACGAARYGSTLCNHRIGTQDMMVTDIISQSLGLKVKKRGHSRMLHMIRKGEFLPFAHAARFHPVHGYPKCLACHCRDKAPCLGPCKNPCTKNQSRCTIEIFEGEGEICTDSAYNRRIGEFSIDLTSFDPPVQDPRNVGITVEFLLDNERALTVSAVAQIDERSSTKQISQKLRTERTEDLVLLPNEMRRFRTIEEFYRRIEKMRLKGLSVDDEVLEFDSSDDEDEVADDGVVLGSDDEDEFKQELDRDVKEWKDNYSPITMRDLPEGKF